MVDETLIVAITVIVVTIIALAVMSSGLVIIKPNERGLYFRMGQFVRVLPSGLNFVTPLISEVKSVDTSAQSLTLSFDDLLSSDNMRFALKMKVHFRVADPEKAILETPDYRDVLKEAAGTSIRVAARKVNKDEFWANSNRIREDLGTDMEKTVSKYGIEVSIIELSP